jgi:hypothetical protein
MNRNKKPLSKEFITVLRHGTLASENYLTGHPSLVEPDSSMVDE